MLSNEANLRVLYIGRWAKIYFGCIPCVWATSEYHMTAEGSNLSAGDQRGISHGKARSEAPEQNKMHAYKISWYSAFSYDFQDGMFCLCAFLTYTVSHYFFKIWKSYNINLKSVAILIILTKY